MNRLRFFFGNKKLSFDITHISLPAGWTCPGAKDCLAKVDKQTGKLSQFGCWRCYSASQECYSTRARKCRWYNFNLLKGKSSKEISLIIEESLPRAFFIRLHVSGDFFSQEYFDAWLEVAKSHPDTVFYGYTKSLPFWIKRLNEIPENFKLVASKGGKFDYLIKRFNLVSAEVVFSIGEAKKKGLEIDHDDSHCQKANKDFALLIHGTQPKKEVRKVLTLA
jgi:hypothetical protein